MKRIALGMWGTAATLLGWGMPAGAVETGGFALSVLVDGVPRRELRGRGKTYVEALQGSEYTLRITNPLGCRVAVALAVDGLNTIDARHTSAHQAAKWVLGPYESAVISGWQMSAGESRNFYFTGERSSYAASLGKLEDLGVIEAAFYREQRRFRPWTSRRRQPAEGEAGDAPAPAAEAAGRDKGQRAGSVADDDYAATGIGERVDHPVDRVDLDLQGAPSAVLRLRYEFRPQLVRLGLLPESPHATPLHRREAARGFEGRYCPDPGR